MSVDPKYDIAISFLARDEQTAAQLNDLAAEGLNVFFFPRKQEELAGTDGLQSMRDPFLQARVVVVLFREPWGNTNWTRIEQAAITDRFLTDGWEWLLFVQLDAESLLPAWLPKTHVRFLFEQYGLEQLAGAVKLRVQERGGKIEPLTALGHAKRVQREVSLINDQNAFFSNRAWIEENVHPQIEELMAHISILVESINSESKTNFIARPLNNSCVLRDDRVSMNFGWRQGFTNSINEEAEFIATEYNGPIFVPAERMMTITSPDILRTTKFRPVLSLERDVHWTEVGTNDSPVSTKELADRIVKLFLDLHRRANKGQIRFMGM